MLSKEMKMIFSHAQHCRMGGGLEVGTRRSKRWKGKWTFFQPRHSPLQWEHRTLARVHSTFSLAFLASMENSRIWKQFSLFPFFFVCRTRKKILADAPLVFIAFVTVGNALLNFYHYRMKKLLTNEANFLKWKAFFLLVVKMKVFRFVLLLVAERVKHTKNTKTL